MEKKVNKILYIIIIIFVVLTVCACGYIVYNIHTNNTNNGETNPSTNETDNKTIIDLSTIDMSKPLEKKVEFNPEELHKLNGTKEFAMYRDSECKISVTYNESILKIQESCVSSQVRQFENVKKVFYEYIENACMGNSLTLFIFKDNNIYILGTVGDGFTENKVNNINIYESIYSAFPYGSSGCSTSTIKFGQTADGTFYYLGDWRSYKNGNKYVDTDYYYNNGEINYIKTNREFELYNIKGKTKAIVIVEGTDYIMEYIIEENNYIYELNDDPNNYELISSSKVKRVTIQDSSSYGNIILEFEDGTEKTIGGTLVY